MNMRASDLASLKNVFKGKYMGVQAGNFTEEDLEAYKYTFQRKMVVFVVLVFCFLFSLLPSFFSFSSGPVPCNG
jgi:hypothetical protein